MNQHGSSIDSIFEAAVERAIERLFDKLGKISKPTMMSGKRVMNCLDISQETLDRFIADGLLDPHIYPGGTKRYYRREQVEALIEQSRATDRAA